MIYHKPDQIQIERNDGSVWPLSDGLFIWRAIVGTKVIEGCAITKKEAEQEALNTERQMKSERTDA